MDPAPVGPPVVVGPVRRVGCAKSLSVWQSEKVGLIEGNYGVGSWIARRARIAPDRVALIAGESRLTYAQLAARIGRLAGGLRRLGIGRGDRVAWLGDNHAAFLELMFAAGLLGAVIAPVNHRLDPDEVAFILDDTEPVVVIHSGPLGATRLPRSVRHRVTVGARHERALDFETLISESPEVVVDESVGFDDLFLLHHTSGTTGQPKGVMLSHANATWNVVNFLTCADFRGDDVTIAIAPFFRVGGTGVNVLPVLFVGGTVVVLLPGVAVTDEELAHSAVSVSSRTSYRSRSTSWNGCHAIRSASSCGRSSAPPSGALSHRECTTSRSRRFSAYTVRYTGPDPHIR